MNSKFCLGEGFKMNSKLCQTIINKETGEKCGHFESYHNVRHRGKSKKCRFMHSNGECKCEKFQPEDVCPHCKEPSNSEKGCKECSIFNWKQKKVCEHKWVGSNVAGIVNCLFCGESNDLRESQGGES